MNQTTSGLGNQVVKGSLWIGALELSNQLLQFTKTFYAAHVLTPDDFGIVGLAFLILAFLDVISTTGMKEAIIQRQGDSQGHLSTVWWVELTKGIFVLVIAFFIAPLVIDQLQLSHSALIENVVKFVGCIFFTQCCTSIGVVYFEKDMRFNQFFLYQFAGTVADVAVSLLLVYHLRNVLALFWGALAGNFVRVLFSFALTRHRPTLDFRLSKAKDLFQFGQWIFKGRILTFFGLQLDSIAVSSFFSLHALGIYQMGFRIGSLPITQASNVMGKIVFPTLSKVQHDPEKQKSFFLTAINVLITGLLPLVILVFCLIPEFTALFLGLKWDAIVPIVRVLILSGLGRIISAIVDYFFWASGSPRQGAGMQGTRVVGFLLLVVPLGYQFGIFGVALSGMFSLMVASGIYLRKACLRLGVTSAEIRASLLKPLIFGCAACMLLFAAKGLTSGNSFGSFALLGLAGILLYLLPGLAFRLFDKPIQIIKSFLQKS